MREGSNRDRQCVQRVPGCGWCGIRDVRQQIEWYPIRMDGMGVRMSNPSKVNGMEEILLPRQEGRAVRLSAGPASLVPLFQKEGRLPLSHSSPCSIYQRLLSGIGLDGKKYGSHSARSGEQLNLQQQGMTYWHCKSMED